jgi:PII-like signaling protein
MMKKALRIYMKANSKVKTPLSFWKKIFDSSLAGYLLKKAKSLGVDQAICFKIQSGYTSNGVLTYDMVEVTPPNLPVVVELIDSESKLIQYFDSIKAELSDEKAYLMDLKELTCI